MIKYFASLLVVVLLASCGQERATEYVSVSGGQTAESSSPPTGVLDAAFVIADQVFNSELMAPYDILHHTIFRDSLNYIRPFIVSETGQEVTTFEGIGVRSHYSFATAPVPDIVVVPSTNGSMSTDMQDEEYMSWLARAVSEARFVITLCDGAFPLAKTGELDGRKATTFPADRSAMQEMFPAVDVVYDVNYVVDDKFITSVGGAKSYEPALYLVELLYGKRSADLTAEGLVIDWDSDAIPHLIN